VGLGSSPGQGRFSRLRAPLSLRAVRRAQPQTPARRPTSEPGIPPSPLAPPPPCPKGDAPACLGRRRRPLAVRCRPAPLRRAAPARSPPRLVCAAAARGAAPPCALGLLLFFFFFALPVGRAAAAAGLGRGRAARAALKQAHVQPAAPAPRASLGLCNYPDAARSHPRSRRSCRRRRPAEPASRAGLRPPAGRAPHGVVAQAGAAAAAGGRAVAQPGARRKVDRLRAVEAQVEAQVVRARVEHHKLARRLAHLARASRAGRRQWV